MASGGVSNLIEVLTLVVWLYGTLVLAARRSVYIIILVGSLLGLGIPVIHMMGKGVGGEIAKSSGAFFTFVWTLLALGVTTIFSVILSARGLRSLQGGQAPGPRKGANRKLIKSRHYGTVETAQTFTTTLSETMIAGPSPPLSVHRRPNCSATSRPRSTAAETPRVTVDDEWSYSEAGRVGLVVTDSGPTDPDVQDYRIRFFRPRFRYAIRQTYPAP